MTVTIEKTAKKYKSRYLVATAVICLGVVLMIADSKLLGGALVVGGLMFYAVTRFGAWWNHG